MLSTVADILTTIPQMSVAGFIIGKYVQVKRISQFTLLYTLLALVIYISTGSMDQVPYTARGLLSMGAQVFMVLSFGRIPKTHGLAFLLLADVCMFVTELPMDAVMHYLAPGFSNTSDLSPTWVVVWKLSYLPMLVVAHLIPFLICQRFFKTEGSPDVTKYFPFFLLQVFLVATPMFMAVEYTENYVMINILCILYLLANIGLDILLLRTFGKINRAHALELQEEQAQNMLQAQLDYYNQMQDNVRTIRQLRHDMNNQLQTLSILLENKAFDTAQEQLASLRETIGRTGKNRFTGNPVVDAVVESKIQVCNESGISLRCSGSLPPEIGIKAINLCSVTANLLDNAIHACQKLDQAEIPEIVFSVTVKEKRVIFCCENPAASGEKWVDATPELHQEHGWGLSILRNIAADYQGELQIQQQNGVVVAILWLIPEALA